MKCDKCQRIIPESAKICPGCKHKIGFSEDELNDGQTVQYSVPNRGDRDLHDDADGPGIGDWVTGKIPEVEPYRDNDEIGEVINEKYKIVEKAGAGGMGVVYRARDVKLGREVALKRLIAPEIGARPSIEHFLQEARAIASLNHKYIVTIHEQEEDDEGPFIVMEYLEGGSLSDSLKDSGKMSVEEALEIVRPVVQALSYAHRRSIFHRDIKPANIMFNAEGEPKLVDFGLAQIARDSELWPTCSNMGTETYMPPEQKRDFKHADHRSDIFSLAKTLYRMVTGEMPDPIDYEIIPDQLRPAIRHALKPRPEDRPFQVQDFMKELESGGAVEAVEEAEPTIGIRCPECGTVNPEDVKYCRSCGSGLYEECPQCGKQERIGGKFCGHCGLPILEYRRAEEALDTASELLKNSQFQEAAEKAQQGLSFKSPQFEKKFQKVKDKAFKKIAELKGLHNRINQTVEQEKYEDAEKLIDKALKINSNQDELTELKKKLPELIKKRGVNEILRKANSLVEQKMFMSAVGVCDDLIRQYGECENASELKERAKAGFAQNKKDSARRYADIKDFDAALAEIKEVLSCMPDDEAKKLQKQYHAEKKEYEDLQRKRKLQTILDEAKSKLESGLYRESIELCENLSGTEFGEKAESIKYHASGKLFNRHEQQAAAKTKRAADLIEQQDYESALSGYDKALYAVAEGLRLKPGDADMQSLGQQLKKDKEKCKKKLQQQHIEQMTADAKSCLKNKNYGQAMQICDGILEMDGKNEEAASLRGKTVYFLAEQKKVEAKKCEECENLKQAYNLINEVLELRPADRETKIIQLRIQDKMKGKGQKTISHDPDDRIAEAREAIENGDYSAAKDICGDIIRKTGRDAETAKMVDRTLGIMMERLKEQAQKYAERDDYGNALKLAIEALEINPKDRQVKIMTLKYEHDLKCSEWKSHLETCKERVKNGQSIKGYVRQIWDQYFSEWEQAAHAGDSGAQWLMGICSEEGYGMEENDVKAVSWYKKAAEQGFAIAQIYFGACLQEGYGIQKNVKWAEELYKKAAANGLDRAHGEGKNCYNSAITDTSTSLGEVIKIILGK